MRDSVGSNRFKLFTASYNQSLALKTMLTGLALDASLKSLVVNKTFGDN